MVEAELQVVPFFVLPLLSRRHYFQIQILAYNLEQLRYRHLIFSQLEGTSRNWSNPFN